VEWEGAARQFEILQQRRDHLAVRAPIAGVVTTFQVRQLLLNRPVQRGEVLLQVMDDQGDWQLELEVLEHRVGRILQEQQLRKQKSKIKVSRVIDGTTKASVSTMTRAEGERNSVSASASAAPSLANPSFPELAVEYRLLTQPESRYFARLTSLATRTVTADPQGSVIEARAALNTSDLPTRTVGAEVRARISCGTSCLGDVLFGDVIEFVQKYLWW
jgi:hypothetical protein